MAQIRASSQQHAGKFREELILVSALFHTPPPPKDYANANCGRVLRHAMIAADQWDQSFEIGLGGNTEDYPVLKQWYDSLIKLIGLRSDPESQRMLIGYGDFEIPQSADYTACFLTPAGKEAARTLLLEHPDWEGKLTAR